MSDDPSESFVPRFPVRAVLIAVAAMLIIAVVSGATTWVVSKRLRTITSSQLTVLTTSERVQHLSDTAELAVDAAVATGNPAYARRYLDVQPRLRGALRILREAIQLSENRATFMLVEQAENQIAKQQIKALKLVTNGQREDALRLVQEPDYLELERAYRSALTRIGERSRSFVAATQEEANRYLAINLATSLAALLLLGVAWALVVRPARQWARQLAEARSRAENATRAKSDFLAVMSHEIRTPLNSIIGFADLLSEDSSLLVQQRKKVGMIQNAGAMLLTVVNDLLDFSKIEAGRVELSPHPFALATFIDNAVSIVRSSAELKGLAVRVEVDPRLTGFYFADESRLRQVLLNLLNNAVKFTATGSITLDVARVRADENVEDMRVTVTDTGPGIAPDRQAMLFQPFVQADASITRRYGGTGLGLSISKTLIELMNGRVGLSSTPNEGSSFWFEVGLPIASRDDLIKEAEQLPPEVFGARILLVEDLPMNQELAKAILGRAGHKIDVAGDGIAAVRAASSTLYDLILMDIQMPRMDGITATRRIRELPGAASGTPILAMTANVLPAQIREFLDAGMDGHIGKPIRPVELHSAIAGALAGRSFGGNVAPDSRETSIWFDRAVFQEVKAMLPPARLRRHVEGLIAETSETLRAAEEATQTERSTDQEKIGAAAHRIISQAGMLGLIRLSNAARDLEDAVREGSVSEAVVELFRVAARDPEFALPAIESEDGADA
ncbi:ATP-binding protein [Allosphingosinicella deserti]|uniref:Sensory/regulatory protein RpfC n=1 Tax=Allosphingosinicella deserti TaxID=2116704 RepID=A0A2P7QVY0_9SPHN|nr:ATP-binding protein [Sphingomonas deserti]PSJ42103.1 hypothetical protein C7I55_07645 [Sphingomonas deserti]